MPVTDNRAARRRANLLRGTLEVLKKIAVVVGTFIVVSVFLLALGVGYGNWATTRVITKMRATPQPMPVSELTGEQLAQLVEAYDPDFYSHKGCSLQAPQLETITQRLVAQYYFDDYQAWLEWVPSCFDAWALNRRMKKDDQLKLFINTVQFGTSRDRDVQGFAQAAELFFGKKWNELNRDEYLQIIAMIADPVKFHIQSEPTANIDRANRLAKFLDGKCKRAGAFDVELINCGDTAPAK